MPDSGCRTVRTPRPRPPPVRSNVFYLNGASLSTMSFRATKFPLAEGVGIFVGILAWDLLSEGRLDVIKALLIAVPSTLCWYAVRCWRQRTDK